MKPDRCLARYRSHRSHLSHEADERTLAREA